MQQPQPTRVVFGAGRLAELPDEVDALGLARVLVLCTPGHRSLGERAAALLGDRSAGVHAGAVQHVPVATADQALWAPDTTPVVALQAAEAARALLAGLSGLAATTGAATDSASGPAPGPVITDRGAEPSGSARCRSTDRDHGGLDARSDLLYGAWLAGTCLGVTTMGLHHQLCHLLGGSLGLPHAETHTVVLPHVLVATLPAASEAAAALERALGGPPAAVVADIAARLGAPTGLGALGADRDALPALAARAAASPYPHPVRLDEAEIAALLDAAWAGPPR